MKTGALQLARRAPLGLLAIVAAVGAAEAQALSAAPRAVRPGLVVVIVVDQFRGDYVDRFGH